MSRSGAMPLRGMSGGFGSQQPPQQSGRSASNRLPNGKLGTLGNSSAAGWAFSGNVPMGSAGLPNMGRQTGSNVSFAQSLSGSQPATPLDLSEFPSLSNNQHSSSANQSSLWSSGGNSGPRSLGGSGQHTPGTVMPQQQGGSNEDLFGPPSSRYMNQGNGQTTSRAPPSGIDEFPPLNRSANGEIGSERGQSLMSSLGLNSQGKGGDAAVVQQQNRGNGLLNALSANNRQNEPRLSLGSLSQQDAKGTDGEYNGAGGGGDGPKTREDKENKPPEVVDPLAGMAENDKWGIKGLRTLMNNYPDYHAMVIGMDPHSLGLDLGVPELISTQSYSLFDDTPPRPVVTASKSRLPDCYSVTNVQPLESKVQSFNEETLFWIFYSCPLDLKQQLAATELHSRNWRWHKKLHVWLTKDEHMTPQILSPNHERGWYVVWDTTQWRKDRREFTLHYNDLDTSLGQGPVGT